TSGKTLDLSEYTLSFAFPQNSGGNMQMPSSDDDSFQMPQAPDSTNDSAAMEAPDNMTGGNDMQRPDNIGDGMGMNGGTGGVSLVYTDDSIESYNNIFDNSLTKTDEDDHNRLISSLKGISEGESLESYIDVDEVLRYTACNVFLMNLDSYFSSMGHNYILAENDGALSMIPWDYNLAFGTYQSSSSSDIINFGIDTVFSGIDAEDRPIIGKLLENEEYLEKYHEYLRQITEEYVQSGLFEETITNAVSLIDEYVQNDSTSFNGYDAFVEGVETLKEYGSLRAESIAGQLSGAIPSTSEAQKSSDALIDSSSLDLSKLGTMNMGGNFKENTQLPDMHNENSGSE
ncbi:MAG: CotH kinase family protein, partial [Oscillospiraceae bacterium]